MINERSNHSLIDVEAITPNVPATQLFFDSEIQKDLMCSSCQHTRSVFERFRDFSLDFPPVTSEVCTLENMIGAYLGNEGLVATCPVCGEEKSEMHKSLRSLPRVFVFHLKRFIANYTTQEFEKCHQDIKFPQSLDITPHLQLDFKKQYPSQSKVSCINSQDSKINTSKEGEIHGVTANPIAHIKGTVHADPCTGQYGPPSEPSPYLGHTKYALRAVVAHEGSSPHSGHYVCYSCNDQNKWKLYDDSVVRDLPSIDPTEKLGASAYLLFYVRTTGDIPPSSIHEGATA